MPTVQPATASLVIASNRGPVEQSTGADGTVVRHRGAGGLIAVLGPAAAASDGIWVASAVTTDKADGARSAAETGTLETIDLPEGPVRVRLVPHEPDKYRDYYAAISTELLWFLHHHLFDLSTEPVFDIRLHTAWRSYRRVNDEFAKACAQHTAPNGTVLVQDYHLSLVPRRLRSLRPDVRTAHFTMTPWAEPHYFATLPGELARELVDGILGADMVCFLAPRWAEAFLGCCEWLDLTVDRRRGAVRDERGHWAAVRCFPVGVDAGDLRARASAADVAVRRKQIAAKIGRSRLMVRIDRMEPTKNVLRGLAAFAELLEREPARRGQVVHFVLAYSSRSELPSYRRYARQVGALAEELNRHYGNAGWQPVILETSNDFALGLAAMSLADVLVVNPLRDGMNLVAKEGAIVSRRDVALILSSFAGAADNLADGCILVNPFDVTGLARQMGVALDLPQPERLARLERLRKSAAALPPREWLIAARQELDRIRR